MITLIDSPLLDSVSAEARANARLRKNRNFHLSNEDKCHRLLNAIEPGSYVAPHRHLDPDKDETMLVVRGRLGLVSFDEAGQAVDVLSLSSDSSPIGVDIAHGTWHCVFALESGTVFLEAKAGPYRALTAAECAPWAPREGAPEAQHYLAELLRLVSHC